MDRQPEFVEVHRVLETHGHSTLLRFIDQGPSRYWKFDFGRRLPRKTKKAIKLKLTEHKPITRGQAHRLCRAINDSRILRSLD